MSLFSPKKKENKEKKLEVVSGTPLPKNSLASKLDIFSVIKKPRVTEKASVLLERNIVVFDVAVKANKHEVSRAVQELYKVAPLKIRMVQIPRKHVTVRGKSGFTTFGKKAYVYLKKGDKIETA